MLDRDRLGYLQALARQARKRMDKKLDRFAPKPGQPPEDVDAARATLQRARNYAHETELLLALMKGGEDNATTDNEDTADAIQRRSNS